MVKKCCVFNCNEVNKEKVFRLPTEETERNRWSAAIPRDNILDSEDTVVCERHRPQNYPQIIVRGKSRPLTQPSVFSCAPPSLLLPSIPTQKNKNSL